MADESGVCAVHVRCMLHIEPHCGIYACAQGALSLVLIFPGLGEQRLVVNLGGTCGAISSWDIEGDRVKGCEGEFGHMMRM